MLEIIRKQIYKLIPGLDKLITLSNAIDSIVTTEDGSIMVNYKKHVVFNTEGGFILNTNDIAVIKTNNSKLFLNPLTINKNDNPDKALDANRDKLLLGKS